MKGLSDEWIRIRQALGKEGFGVLTEIDVQATLKKKLGVEVPPYNILGACNPQFAHRARVEIMDPHAVLQLVGRPEIGAIAAEVRSRVQRVLQAL